MCSVTKPPVIAGVLDQLELCDEVSIRSKCMVQLLVIMCKLADGQDITVEYEEGTEVICKTYFLLLCATPLCD